MVNIAVGDIFGPYTGKDAAALLDQFSGSPLQVRNVNRFVHEVESRLQGHIDTRLKAADEQLQELFDHLEDQTISLKEETQKVTRGIKSGRIPPTEGRRELSRIGRTQREIRERAAQLRRSDDALQAMARMDPSDYESQYLNTTPALRNQLPVFTEAMLNGSPA